MSGSQAIVSRNLEKLVHPRIACDGIDLDASLSGQYGLTSLSMVLLLTSVCDEADIELTTLTEDDLSHLRTARDIVALVDSVNGRDVK